MFVRILGEVDLVTGEGPVAIGSRNQRIVLAVLGARRGTAVDIATLVDAVWDDDPPATAVETLRSYVSRLRRHLGESLVIESGGYRLSLGPEEVDADLAQVLVERAADAGPDTALPLLDEALAQWRGPPLAGFDHLAALRGTAVRLGELRLAALDARVAALVASGRHGDAIQAAEELVAEEPLREGVWIALADALVAEDRNAEALRAVQRAAAALGEAGLEVSPALRAVEQRAFAPDAAPPAPRDLPVAPDELVGRADVVDGIVDALATERLVTVVGPGGAGKTRVALDAARKAGGRFRWGAREVRLAGVDETSAVLDAVAGDLGLVGAPGGPEATVANAAHLDVLVVLDNCEHVIDAAARVASLLTTAGPRARVLATSRSPLEVAGERVWPLDAMSPDEAAALFVARTTAAGLDADGALDQVAEIVELVDRLPLAIEMAAAQARHVPLPELRRRLDDEVGSLRSQRRDAGQRHQTLAAVVDWSERLLDEDEHDLWCSMSVFEGAVTASDVEQVTGRADAFDLLCRLADRSMLLSHTDGRTTRFGMLRTIRGRARTRLDARGDRGPLVAAHAAWVVASLTDADERWRTEDARRAGERIASLLDDARAALRWSRRHDPDAARRICAALYRWGQSRLRDEVLGWSEDLADDPDEPLDPTRAPHEAIVLCAASFRAATRGDIDRAQLHAASAAAATDSAASASAREVLADVHLYRGEVADAEREARTGIAEATAAGDPVAWAMNVAGAALAASYGGDHASAALLVESEPPGPLPPAAAAWLAYARGEIVLDRDPDRALADLDDAIAIGESVEDHYASGVARVSVASLRARTGDVDEATRAFVDIIRHWRGRGDRTHQLTTLRNLVTLLVRRGEPDRAALLLGAIGPDAIVPSYGDEADRLADAHRQAVTALGEDRVAELERDGAALDLDAAAIAALRWLSPTS